MSPTRRQTNPPPAEQPGPDTAMPGSESTPAHQVPASDTPTNTRHGLPGPGYVAEAIAIADEIGPSRPARLGANPTESLSQLRVRAMQLAEYHRLIEVYIGPENAAAVNPSEWRYLFTPAGMTLQDLGRKAPPYLHATEVLPMCFQLAVASGIAEAIADLRYRDDLPW